MKPQKKNTNQALYVHGYDGDEHDNTLLAKRLTAAEKIERKKRIKAALKKMINQSN